MQPVEEQIAELRKRHARELERLQLQEEIARALPPRIVELANYVHVSTKPLYGERGHVKIGAGHLPAKLESLLEVCELMPSSVRFVLLRGTFTSVIPATHRQEWIESNGEPHKEETDLAPWIVIADHGNQLALQWAHQLRDFGLVKITFFLPYNRYLHYTCHVSQQHGVVTKISDSRLVVNDDCKEVHNARRVADFYKTLRYAQPGATYHPRILGLWTESDSEIAASVEDFARILVA